MRPRTMPKGIISCDFGDGWQRSRHYSFTTFRIVIGFGIIFVFKSPG